MPNAASAFKFGGCSNVAGGVSMSWGVKPGRVYRIVGIEGLTNDCWSTQAGPWTATVGQVQMEWTDTNALTRSNWFYQVEVLIP